MPEYRYLIIGGGMTADAAVEGIRQADPNGTIGVISVRNRSSLQSPAPFEGALERRRGGEHLAELVAESRRRAPPGPPRGEARSRSATPSPMTPGPSYQYQKLLLATGGAPRQLPGATGDIIYYRTLADYRHLRKHADKQAAGGRDRRRVHRLRGRRRAPDGRGRSHHAVSRRPASGPRLFPADLSRFLVGLLPGEGRDGADRRGRRRRGTRATRRPWCAPPRAPNSRPMSWWPGSAFIPAIELAEQAGLATGNGVVVDEFCRTSDPDIFAAGDVASFPNPALRRPPPGRARG